MAQKKYLKLNLLIPLFIVVGIFFFVFIRTIPASSVTSSDKKISDRFWEYQCIDTMKTSRDKARAWADRADLTSLIEKEMKAIKYLGANCVAIDTPYDKEFREYLKLWVDSARRNNLKIWYRGNFSWWEEWFDYPKGTSVERLFSESKNFIYQNPDLFLDGDVFTIAPEAENGGPFDQVEKDEHEAFRKFLIDEYNVSKQAFEEIDKDVDVSWLSMNGGLAKRMFDQETIDSLDRVVAIDHYIKDPAQMSEFVNYFADNFGAKVVIGEFGAPIPEINGAMNEQEQADFTEELFAELYKERSKIKGVNYWILTDGSTALINPDGSFRKAAHIVRKYFKPAKLSGTVKNKNGIPLANIKVVISANGGRITTDGSGKYQVLLTEGNYQIIAGDSKNYKPVLRNITVNSDDKKTLNITLVPVKENLIEKFRINFLNLFKLPS